MIEVLFNYSQIISKIKSGDKYEDKIIIKINL
jgi:hypothetical protein